MRMIIILQCPTAQARHSRQQVIKEQTQIKPRAELLEAVMFPCFLMPSIEDWRKVYN